MLEGDAPAALDSGGIAYTTPDRLLRDFASRGIVALAPEDLGVPPGIHAAIYAKERQAFRDNRGTITTTAIPEMLQIIAAPGLVAACDRLLGRHWAIVPFTHNAPFASGAHDQHWHKDDNGPFNGRKQRHHHAVQLEMLYYPQAVRLDMGPTATVPYSQYWAFNHEENQDNFAGADHLDFAYHLSGMEREPVSGPKSRYDADDIARQRTRHDIRMRRAITDTGWPLVRQFEVGPLRPGSVVLYSHNLFHRGNHRRDDWRTWQQQPRFMWRFWLYRTTEPADGERECEDVDWNGLGMDPLTQHDLADSAGRRHRGLALPPPLAANRQPTAAAGSRCQRAVQATARPARRRRASAHRRSVQARLPDGCGDRGTAARQGARQRTGNGASRRGLWLGGARRRSNASAAGSVDFASKVGAQGRGVRLGRGRRHHRRDSAERPCRPACRGRLRLRPLRGRGRPRLSRSPCRRHQRRHPARLPQGADRLPRPRRKPPCHEHRPRSAHQDRPADRRVRRVRGHRHQLRHRGLRPRALRRARERAVGGGDSVLARRERGRRRPWPADRRPGRGRARRPQPVQRGFRVGRAESTGPAASGRCIRERTATSGRLAPRHAGTQLGVAAARRLRAGLDPARHAARRCPPAPSPRPSPRS